MRLHLSAGGPTRRAVLYGTAAVFWLIFAGVATAAGIVRETWLVLRVGELRAHQERSRHRLQANLRQSLHRRVARTDGARRLGRRIGYVVPALCQPIAYRPLSWPVRRARAGADEAPNPQGRREQPGDRKSTARTIWSRGNAGGGTEASMRTVPFRRHWPHSIMDAILWIAFMMVAILALLAVLGFLA
jgi:hypothetical protein